MSESAKRILFFVPRPLTGGEATAFMSLAKGLEGTSDYVVSVVLAHPFPDSQLAIAKKYIIGFAFPRQLKNRFLFRVINFINLITNYYFYIKLAKKFSHDIFVVYSAPDFSYWVNYSRKPTYGWFHFMPFAIKKRWPDRLRAYFAEMNLRRFTKLFAITNEVSNAWCARYRSIPPPIVVMNLVDVDGILAAGSENQFDITPMGTNIICVGRISPEKGVDRLVSATRKLHDAGYNFVLWIVGEGPQIEHCRKIAGTDAAIRFLGAKANPYPYMSAADLLAMPSRSEGLGLVLWEALILGTPVMATSSGGAVTALGNGKFGKLVDNDEVSIFNGIKSWLDGQQKIGVCGEAFRVHIREQNQQAVQRIREVIG